MQDGIDGADESKKPVKYGSKFIPYQITKMQEFGIHKRHMLAKIAGGSMMFLNKEKTVLPDIGKQNILSAKKILNSMNIRIISENVGGHIGRNIEFSPKNQKLKVTIFGKPPIFI